MHIEAEQPATVPGAPYASGELPSFRTGAYGGPASSAGLSTLVGLSSRQKHPQSWLHQRGFVGPCWVVPWHFLGLQFMDLQVQDTWRVAPQGNLSGTWLARCECEPQAWLACSAQGLPSHPIRDYSLLLPLPLPSTVPWANLQGTQVLCHPPYPPTQLEAGPAPFYPPCPDPSP